MQNETLAAKKALTQKAHFNGARDMYNLTSLHYASHHDNAVMVKISVGMMIAFMAKS